MLEQMMQVWQTASANIQQREQATAQPQQGQPFSLRDAIAKQAKQGMPDWPNPNYGYGMREDGTNKGLGFYGKVPAQQGQRFSTEVSQTMDDLLYPLIHQGSTPSQIQALANGLAPTRQMSIDAYDSAMRRIQQGMSPFAGPGEQVRPRLTDMYRYDQLNKRKP